MHRKISLNKFILFLGLLLSVVFKLSYSSAQNESDSFVATMRMNMMILPGTSEYLKKSVERAHLEGAKLLVVYLDTPGGMLQTSQEMIQEIFNAPIPIVVYVSPSGATATSAGVFITLAGHIAAMSPGTTIGAAHPVAGDGKNIEGDMRAKAENMTIAMVKSISEQRGRNIQWAEKSVKESNSITESDALKLGVVDVVGQDILEILKQIKGRRVKIGKEEVILEDYSRLPVRSYEISFKQKTINTLANPNVAALLWLAATTGLSLELYNPGAILPGVVGLICLILALAVSQIIPITQGGILLLILGSVLVGAELFVASGVLGVAGLISIVFGAIYLIDETQAPGISVNLALIVPVAVTFGSFMLFVAYSAIRSGAKKQRTGSEGMVGETARALGDFSEQGKVFVHGEVWNAQLESGAAIKDEILEVVSIKEGLILLVKKRS